MRQELSVKKLLLSLYHYFCFFLLMAFLISCCMMLFVSTMADTMGIVLTEENIKKAAIITFWNVVFLSLICTIVDALRRKLMVERPVRKIVEAAEKIAKGDYSVRIAPMRSFGEEQGLDKIVECYNKMAEELSGIETLQTDFIANVSHELKTPIAVMQNYATLLKQLNLSEEDRLYYAKAVSDGCTRLSNLVTNILKLNKLENQQIFPKVEEYNLSEQLCECLLRFESIWEEKRIEIKTEIEEEVRVNADPELLSLIWNNLFSNALKFTDKGGTISLVLKRKDEHVSVSVADTGCGIAPEVGRHIFDKFYQGDTSHATQGNGLGLALVHRVISIVGGDISVESEVGKGSIFTVLLKVK